MTDSRLCPPATLNAGDERHGFRITRVTPLPEIRITAYEAVHLRTGAQFLHLHCDDRENWYVVTFRTPPADSTGVAHILEHSVLAGSERYPVKDAFNELGKATLRTFLNAFTAPDFTCYPVASQVEADFYNLASVYTDLVFRPLLTPNTFMQEGHHLEVTDGGELALSGIVYNEMKGAYGSPEAVATRITLRRLFPDSPYGHESGGHPDHIPDLTYEQWKEFHRKFYSTGNARIFFYGDLPTTGHLEFLAGQFERLETVSVDSAIPEQPRWPEPRTAAESFPVGPEDPLEKKTTVNIAWLTTPMADLEERMILEVLAEALVGSAAGPLRQALIDSGLGEDLSPSSGLDSWYRQLPFVVGLRGTEPDQAEAIEDLAVATLAKIAEQGVPRSLLEAAFHQVEYKGREITQNRGLEMFFRSISTWLHDLDPITPLEFPTLVEGLQARWEAEPDLFNQAIRRWFLDNPHRLRVVITPSRTAAQEFDERVRARLARVRASMSEADLAVTKQKAETLLAAQRESDPPEALASLPQLRIDQIPRRSETIPTAERTELGVRILEHDIFSNGVGYVDLAFDISDLPEELMSYLPLFGAAATEMGAAGEDYAAFATRQALYTGGVFAESKTRARSDGGPTLQLFTLRARALRRNLPRMTAILRDILLSGDLSDTVRLKDVLAEERNGLRAAVAPRGHVFAWRAAAASLSTSGWRDEQWGGAHQVRFLQDAARRFDQAHESIRADLRRMREWIFRRGRLIINVTGDADDLKSLRGPISELIAALPEGGMAGPPNETRAQSRRRGVTIPGQVCYVARVLPAPLYNHPMAPLVMALANHLGDGVLYKRIRVEGGAYGGMSSYNPNTGVFAMLSYRDPNLEKTVEVYDGALASFLQEDLDGDTVRRLIIATVADLDRPMNPATKGAVALDRVLAGITDDDRQRFRDAVLSIDPAGLRRAVEEILQPAMAAAQEAVVAPKQRIEAANAALRSPFELEGLE